MTLIKSISGIRGTIGGNPGKGLTPIDVVKFTSAFGEWIKEHDLPHKIIIGRDARPSGVSISQLVSQTMIMAGFDVIDLGLTTTPTLEIAIPLEKAGGGIMLTASHNPLEWNALKLLNAKGEFIKASEGKKLLEIAESEYMDFAKFDGFGSYEETDKYIDIHIRKILDLPLVDRDAILARKFRIVVDAVNSTGGIAIPRLLKELGVYKVKELFCSPTGDFPHNPEPLPEHLGEISKIVKSNGYDLGVVVDPDVDRLALISENGSFFGEEYTLVSIADYVLGNTAGNTVSNLSSTQALGHVTSKYGGVYHAAAVGEVNVVAKMKEVHAVIGGEGNGGVIYPALHYGRDALVGIALFLTSLAKSGKPASQLRSGFPDFIISKNKIELSPEINVDLILESIRKKYSDNPVNTDDGLRIDFPETSEWVHLRKSNTEPIIRIYAESDSSESANNLASKVISEIQALVPNKS